MEGVGSPPQRAGRIRSPSWKAGMVWEALPEGREGSREMEGVRSPPRRAGRIGRLSQRAGQG